MNRFWTAAGAIAASVVLQVMLASHVAPFGVTPSFPLLVVITLAFVQGPGSGASAGFAAGLALDLLGNGPVGAWALVLTVIGYLAGMLEANLFAEGWLMPVTVAMIAGIAAEFAYLLSLSVLGVDVSFWKSVIGVVIPRGIYISVLAMLLYPWLARFLRTDRSVKSFRRLA